MTDAAQLPKNAMAFLRRIEEEAKVSIGMVSTGPRRRSNIVLDTDLLAF